MVLIKFGLEPIDAYKERAKKWKPEENELKGAWVLFRLSLLVS